MHAQRRVIVVGRSVDRSVTQAVCLSARFLSNRGCCRYQTWICGYVQRGPKILYSYYARCALIRDHQPTAWDGFAHPAEAEATCIWKVSPQIVVERFISKNLYFKCQVRGSFCEISEEYDVKTIML